MKLPKKFLACAMVAALLGVELTSVGASSISGLQQQIDKNKNELNQVTQQLQQYEAEREDYLNYLDDQKSEMINLMKDIVYNEEAIVLQEESIEKATKELEAACVLRDKQYQETLEHIQYMYENGSDSYLLMLFSVGDFSDLLNRVEYVDSLYAYDRNVLTKYEQLVKAIEVLRTELEAEKLVLESEQKSLAEQKTELERIMAELEDTISDYDILVADAEKQAAAYKQKISKDQAQLTMLKKQEEERKRKEAELKKQEEERKKQEAAASQNNNTNSNQGGENSGNSNITVSGSGTGAEIAETALQYVGNPYVYGGTSLTNGADCSGFIMTIYSQYGYALPHSSFSMRSSGKGVTLAEAQPGDIICYSGHVALYIGNGQIVHAKNSKYGIVTDPVYYGWGGTGPTVLAVRRIIY